MEEPDEFEIAKMEIRGLLISNKEGCSLAEFKKQYRSMLGRALPFIQLGYKDEIELLSDMPDAVHLTPSGRDYYLYGIADEKSKHIQKMVSRQKTTNKKKPLGRLNPTQRYYTPPSAPRRSYGLPTSSAFRWSNELASSAARKSHELPPSYASKRSSELPPSSAPKKLSDLPPSSTFGKAYEVPPRFQISTNVKKELPQSVMREIVDVVSKYSTGLSLRDVLKGYRQYYEKELSFKDYGFFTLQECLEEIPSLVLKPKVNDTIVMCLSNKEKSYAESLKTKISSDNSSATSNKAPKISEVASPTVQSSQGFGSYQTTALNRPNFEPTSCDPFTVPDCPPGFSFPPGLNRANGELHRFDPFSCLEHPSVTDSSKHQYSEDLCGIPSPQSNTINYNDHENQSASSLKTRSNQLDDFSFSTKESPNDSPVSDNIRNNLIRVVENCPHGIWAREFPALYKEITKTEFDLHSLGFYDLASFIDSVPDIMIRRSLPNSKKDYLIYPAWTTNEMDREDPKSAAFAIEIIIGNSRKILQANEEGITLKEFLYVYSLNCSEPLYYVDLGFDSIESLLSAIADRVPLKFETKEGVKSVHLVLSEEKSFLPPPVDLEPLPPSVISPYNQFAQQTLPPEMDLGQFFPVYVCSVINPDHIYIQLQGEDTSEALLKKYQDLEKFYSSTQSKGYGMKDVHITAGSIGVALWPVDMHWYRIRIMSVISPETVRVFYVDYGTIEIIPKSMLRYIREEFFDFPTQAIRASLAYVKPPLGVNSWNPRAKTRILELCTDITVMTKIHDIEEDGLLSVVLCDTNGEEDMYVNDVLLKERLVCGISDADSNPQCRAPQEPPHCVPEIPPPMLPTPSANVADPSQVIGMLLQAYNSLAANKAAAPTIPANFPVDPALITAALAQAAQNFSPNPSAPAADYSNLFQAPATFAAAPIPGPKPPLNESWQYPLTSPEYPGETASRSSYTPPSEESSEVFDDVDDAFFDEFYQKVSLVTKRHVKRIRTGDGYMFHIVIYESKPFVSCGDICSLIWSNKDSDYLLQRLQNQESNLTNTLVWENQNEDMFDQLRRFHVKGFKELNEQTCILVYPLNTLVQILNVFGHPSAELRSRILSESSSFNPKHPMWMELSEVEIPDGEEEFAGKTDDDKLNRLCLYDLQTMKQGIRIRCQNLELRRTKSPDDVSDEEEKLRLLYNKVIGRIKEIQQICSNFAEA